MRPGLPLPAFRRWARSEGRRSTCSSCQRPSVTCSTVPKRSRRCRGWNTHSPAPTGGRSRWGSAARSSTRREARVQQRLAAVGEMAAGIAHEIRNPLASMAGSIQILRDELPLTPDQSQLMDIVLRESDPLNDTIRNFLAYARPQRATVADMDVRRVITDTARLLENSAEVADTHHIEVDVPAEPVV